MSRLSKEIKNLKEYNKYHANTVINFEGGESFTINPLMRLTMIASSSIFGEASFYRSNIKDGKFGVDASWYNTTDTLGNDRLFKEFDGKTTTEVFEEAIDAALDYDFEETLKMAVTLRLEYYMRLNPQIIMVRASIHPKRQEWTKANPGKFAVYQMKVLRRGDEPMSQLAYYLWLNDGNKNKIPSILKRSLAIKLDSLSRFDVNKYKNAEIGMINAVRLTHAHSDVLDELMKTGTIEVEDNEVTWEQKRSAGMSWEEIYKTTPLGHMACLRNIRNFFSEVTDDALCKGYLMKLKNGVELGNQFPYRYYSAYKQLENAEINHKGWVLDALEECIDISIKEMPKLPGKTVILSDNSGSAWDTFTSEYGTTQIAEIDNLSAVIAGMCSEEAQIVKFGTTCKWFEVSKRNGALTQANEINNGRYTDVGGSTEPGVDEFFQEILNKKIKYDNIIIYSDLQVGHLTLGRRGSPWAYRSINHSLNMNVYQALETYRREVNPKVNFCSIQTAGYDNVLVPEMAYRCAFLSGWTGKETQFMERYINIWDELEQKK